ncbi:MAG: DUF1298 domain-containing protein [Acidimicrobiales bacterium]|nr:DUF1298 domain-containing protein [Acidimicrobiales bacterium]
MTDRPENHMRDTDAFAWYMERDPLLRSTVVSVALLDREPDLDVLEDRADRASRTVPGLRHKVVEAPYRLAPPRWVVDPDFDLSWHLRQVAAPPPNDLATVLDLARHVGMAAFDPARPLWEWTLVDGLADGSAALVLKLHHSLTDGIGGMQLAASLFDLERDAPDRGPLPDAPEGERPSATGILLDAIGYQAGRAAGVGRQMLGGAAGAARSAVRDPVGTVRSAMRTAASVGRFVAPINETRSPVMTERRLGWHYDVLDVPLDDLRRAAKAAGGTLNDAFLGGVTGGLRRFHERYGAVIDELRVTMPISVRTEDDPAGGNRITLIRFGVPSGIVDPTERMLRLHDLAADAQAEPAIPHSNAIAAALNVLPPQVVGGMLKHVDFLASNVPGLATPLYIGGAKLTAFYPFGPTIGAAVNVTLLSYCGTCSMGVTTDTGAVEDPDALLDCLGESFAEIMDLGGDHAGVRFPSRSG